MKIIFEKISNPVFRPERPNNGEYVETVFNEEEDNTNEFGQKIIRMFDNDNKELIGNISFDYIENNNGKFIKIRFVALEDDYKRKDLSLRLYKHLIDLANQNGLNGICSDQVVQGGALASWKKLQEDGYNLTINPELLDKYTEFCTTYNEGKYFKESLTAPSGESVFVLNI